MSKSKDPTFEVSNGVDPQCPNCGFSGGPNYGTKVMMTRADRGMRFRTRRCGRCSTPFLTVEVTVPGTLYKAIMQRKTFKATEI